MTTFDPNEILAGSPSGSYAKFDNIGDKHAGEILAIEARQDTVFGTDEPAFTKKGKPKMVVIVTIQTAERDPENPDDDGVRTLYLKGWDFLPTTGIGALSKALRESGASKIEVGGKLAVQLTGFGTPPQPGFQPPKEYAAAYQAPVAGVDLSALGGDALSLD